ncbi:MAG TPA: GGDEF domain-containing protein, partial [Elusimicrobiota bacterium]|nr:GGDEF domain-containing protein [Elusimicrobiota bacterium]
RYGGDELAVLLPETDAEQAQLLAKRLLEEIGCARFPTVHGSAPPKVSVSIGGACFPADAVVIDEFIRKADEALYASKKGGRARVHWTGKPAALFSL